MDRGGARSVAALAQLLLCLGAFAGPAAAQPLSSQARLSVLTVSPGAAIEALFGHTALRLVDEPTSRDLVFNYGTFDFGPGFVPRFVYGQLDYYLSVMSMADALEMWRAEERSVFEQLLDLSPAEVQALANFLADNARPERSGYRYDFLSDNCTTRVDDALRTALAGSLVVPEASDGGGSFRRRLDPYLAAVPGLHFGIDLLMGLPVDELPDDAQRRFLPDAFMEALYAWTLVGVDGGERALVAATERLHDAGHALLPAPAVDWVAILGWGLVLLAWPRGPARARRILDGALLLLVGLLGLLVLLLWTATLHHVTASNLNLLWAWPTHLVAGLALLVRPGARWLTPYLRVCGASALLLCLGWTLLPQELPSAGLPLALAVALRGLRRPTSLAA